MKPCIECGVPSDGSRCGDHKIVRKTTNTTHVAYANRARWKNLSRRLRRLQPFCDLCGTSRDLTVDHIVRVTDRPEWTYEIPNLRVVCRSCNGRLSSTPATPEVEAQIADAIAAKKTRGGHPPEGSLRSARQAQGQLRMVSIKEVGS